ncbi:DUF6950 family protein [Martelella soudanensis]|uniref:DUF6950 family protein n=1 Tax=unclassified Martelella TaxID=2629616 RepID=UPI0015DE4C83|nr:MULTISPECIES: hypothetical protein [unclassified Martelella]
MAGELSAPAVMAAVETHMGGPFVWGACDCWSGPCAAFEALTGRDPLAHLRGRYDSRFSAARIIARAGGPRHLAQDCMARAGLRRVAGHAGAIGLFRNGAGFSLGIIVGPGLMAAKTETGFGFVSEWIDAWAL